MQNMPSRNIYKDYIAESYYHIYNRGIDKQDIFKDEDDYIVFLGLLKRYLSGEVSRKSSGVPLPSYRGQIELLAFCLMPNHFHLFIYQTSKDGMRLLLKSLGVAYAMYFNKKYQRLGPVFQQRYKASRITNDDYLLHISRYIHLNPKDYRSWQWSSYPYYEGKYKTDWVMPNRILELFTGDYSVFLEDYKEQDEELDGIKSELANS